MTDQPDPIAEWEKWRISVSALNLQVAGDRLRDALVSERERSADLDGILDGALDDFKRSEAAHAVTRQALEAAYEGFRLTCDEYAVFPRIEGWTWWDAWQEVAAALGRKIPERALGVLPEEPRPDDDAR